MEHVLFLSLFRNIESLRGMLLLVVAYADEVAGQAEGLPGDVEPARVFHLTSYFLLLTREATLLNSIFLILTSE